MCKGVSSRKWNAGFLLEVLRATKPFRTIKTPQERCNRDEDGLYTSECPSSKVVVMRKLPATVKKVFLADVPLNITTSVIFSIVLFSKHPYSATLISPTRTTQRGARATIIGTTEAAHSLQAGCLAIDAHASQPLKNTRTIPRFIVQ